MYFMCRGREIAIRAIDVASDRWDWSYPRAPAPGAGYLLRARPWEAQYADENASGHRHTAWPVQRRPMAPPSTCPISPGQGFSGCQAGGGSARRSQCRQIARIPSDRARVDSGRSRHTQWAIEGDSYRLHKLSHRQGYGHLPNPHWRGRQHERLASLSQQQRGAHHLGDRAGGVRRHSVANALAPGLIAQIVQFQIFLWLDQRLQRGQFQRCERAVPGAGRAWPAAARTSRG